MAMNQVSVTGITPVATGDNWFCIDSSGTFSLDSDITATIYLVGGGCDGDSGTWIGYDVVQLSNGTWKEVENTGTGTSYAGKGGDGGYIRVVSNVKISKGENCTVIVSPTNNKSGTSLSVNNQAYDCISDGTSKTGGTGGGVMLDRTIIQPTDGIDGISTPYQVVGSSGGGGLACNGFNVTADDGNVSRIGKGGVGAGSTTEHRTAGTDATNYGCGGGGGAICGQIGQGQLGGKGMPGCIIVSYTIEEEVESKPTLVVQKHYKRVCNTKKTCNTDYYSSSSRYSSCGNNECGCGQSRHVVEDAGYTDTLHIGIVK